MKMAKQRQRQVRSDASIAATRRSIAATTGLPIDSIKIVLPNGRKAPANGHVKTLKKKYD
jgi:hypothetical protein